MGAFRDFFNGGGQKGHTNAYGQIYDQSIMDKYLTEQDWKGMNDYTSNFPGMQKDSGLFGSIGGWGSALQGVGSLAQAYMGYQGLGQAQDQLDFNKNVFNRNIKNQAKLTNAQLEGKHRGRINSTGNNNAYGNYESLDTYMTKNRVDGSAIS